MNLMLTLAVASDLPRFTSLTISRGASHVVAHCRDLLGAIVEEGPTERLVARSAHPYTAARGCRSRARAARRRDRIRLHGEAASLTAAPAAVVLRRAARAAGMYTTPPQVMLEAHHWSACHFAHEVAG